MTTPIAIAKMNKRIGILEDKLKMNRLSVIDGKISVLEDKLDNLDRDININSSGGRKTRKKKKIKSLSTSDYKKILKFYKLSIPKKRKTLKKKAEKIIAKKFCSCIKKVAKKFKQEGIAIGICTKSVVRGKGLKRGKFRCKKSRKIRLYKGGKRRLKKRTRRR